MPIDGTGETQLSEGHFLDESKREAFRNTMLEQAQSDGRLKAIACMAKHIQSGLGATTWQTLSQVDSKTLMNKIQGELSAEALLQKLAWEKTEAVSQTDFEKTQAYLTDWVHRAEEESLRLFIRTVTSNNALCKENLRVDIFDRDQGFIPVAHTCFFTLELSAHYPSQQWFDEKLSMLLKEGMAGSGFQVA